VQRNIIVKNGGNVDPERPATPAADIVYDGSGSVCFSDNLFGTDSPEGIVASFPCL
jgi:hypothetical protein